MVCRIAGEYGAGAHGDGHVAIVYLHICGHGYREQIDEFDDKITRFVVIYSRGRNAFAHIVSTAFYVDMACDILVTAIVSEYLLGVVPRSEVNARGVEVYQVWIPVGVSMASEEWGIGSHVYDVGIALHVDEVQGFAQGGLDVVVAAMEMTGIFSKYLHM